MLVYTVNVQPNSSRRQSESALPEPDWHDAYLEEVERKNNQLTLTGSHYQKKPSHPDQRISFNGHTPVFSGGTPTNNGQHVEQPLPEPDWGTSPNQFGTDSKVTTNNGKHVEKPMTEVSWDDI